MAVKEISANISFNRMAISLRSIAAGDLGRYPFDGCV